MDRDLKRSLILLATVTLVTAWFGELFYHPDEHYQILEFLSWKLGITPVSELPWEFSARIRPWLHPLLYFLIAKPLMVLGVTDMFTIVFVLRVATGLLCLVALAVFVRAILPTLQSDEERRAFVRYLPLFGFLPYLFVRTSSEAVSGAFFALGLALAIKEKSGRRLALAGLFCGLAFECRYQTAFLGLGLFAWLAIIARVRFQRLAAFVSGGLCTLPLGALADRWGYGSWVFPPYNYFHANIVEGVAAKQFGSEPVFAFLYLMPAQIFFAITLILMAAMLAMWMRNPRHPVSWATLPFVLAHMATAHKEARFLFPMTILATAFPVLGFSPRLPRWRAVFARVWSWRGSWAMKAVTGLSLLAMAYFAFYPFGVRPHMPMARYLYRHWPGPIYSFDNAFQSYPIFRPAGFRSQQLGSQQQLEALLDKGPVYLMSPTPLPPPVPQGVRVTLLYSEFPLARLGYGQTGADYIRFYTAFDAKHRYLRLLPLHWYTLYRVERSAMMRS
jgi:phosphatidylinositol glycan class B